MDSTCVKLKRYIAFWRRGLSSGAAIIKPVSKPIIRRPPAINCSISSAGTMVADWLHLPISFPSVSYHHHHHHHIHHLHLHHHHHHHYLQLQQHSSVASWLHLPFHFHPSASFFHHLVHRPKLHLLKLFAHARNKHFCQLNQFLPMLEKQSKMIQV